MTYHSHELRDECWNIIDGDGEAVVDGEMFPVKKGSTVSIPKGAKHTLLAKTGMTVIEVQMGEEISIHDKVKCEIDFEEITAFSAVDLKANRTGKDL